MKKLLGVAAAGIAALAAAIHLHSSGEAEGPSVTVAPSVAAAQSTGLDREPDVIYVPTPQPVVEAMLEMAKVRSGDLLYDLGSGDGRIPITAAKTYGVRAVGIDIDPERIAEANVNAKAAGVTDKVSFRRADLFKTDLRKADVVTLYLLQSLNEKLRPKLLAELKPGSRIVSHTFDMGDWKPEETREIGASTIYLWTVPPR